MSSALRIIVTGYIAQCPLGGMTWHYFHYVLGLASLGHDVYYIEDTGGWPYDPAEDGLVKGCEKNVQYLSDLMERYGFEDRWAYRFVWKSRWFGMSEVRRNEVIDTADLVINVSGSIEDPERYRSAARMAYIDTDPVFTQVKLAKGHTFLRRQLAHHDVLFSFGESLQPPVPDTGDTWVPTRQPVVLSEWRPSTPHRRVLTTVMTWNPFKPIEYGDRTFGQKDVEFERFIELAQHVERGVLEVAANPGRGYRLPRDLLRRHGWVLVEPRKVCSDYVSYRDYIEGSAGEWSVAKNAYVQGRSGWFSCRSACYLAAGRPVVLQDTGFSAVFPVGEGLLAYDDLDQAAACVRDVLSDYDRHAAAALAIAEEFFDARKVLGALLARCFAKRAETSGD